MDRAERLHRAAADLGFALASRKPADFGRLVSDAQQGLRGGLRLHARPDPQSRRQRIALVLHPADWSFTASCATAWAIFRCSIIGGRSRTCKAAGGSPIRRCSRRERWQPDFFYIYLPHLDYAAQRAGPESAAADDGRGRTRRRDRPLGRADGRSLSRPARSGWRPASMPSARSITSSFPTACCAKPVCWS